MNNKEFIKLAKDRWIRPDTVTFEGMRLVLVEGCSATHAAKSLGISTSTITRPINRLKDEIPRCEHCGQIKRNQL